jgi:hypothetical protein
MAGRKKGFNKDGSVDKRYGKKQGGKIQEIIDSGQAPGVHISAEHQSAPSSAIAEERRMAIYKENTGGKDPNEPMCHDKRTQTGGDWDIQGTRRNL